MKKPTFLWQAAGFALTTFAGTLLHFLYEWTGGSILAAPFSAINESTWEHMKLMYWPMLLVAGIQRLCFRDLENFWCVKLAGFLTGIGLIPVLFYTCNGAFGKTPDWINIAIFYTAAAAAFLLEWQLFRKNWPRSCHPGIALAAIGLLGVLFVVFSFAPPQLPLFQPPAE